MTKKKTKTKRKSAKEVTDELIATYKEKYEGLNQAQLRKKNPKLLNRLRYRLGPEALAEIVPKAIGNGDITTEDIKAYQAEYYERNKAEIQKRRRERYQKDPEYRQGIRERGRNWRKRQRPKNYEEERRSRHQPYETSTRGHKHVHLYGEDLTIYSLGELASEVGYDRQTLYSWEEAGVLPEPTALDDAERRWYSERFIKWFAGILKLRYQDGFQLRLADFAPIVEDEYFKECERLGIDPEEARL